MTDKEMKQQQHDNAMQNAIRVARATGYSSNEFVQAWKEYVQASHDWFVWQVVYGED